MIFNTYFYFFKKIFKIEYTNPRPISCYEKSNIYFLVIVEVRAQWFEWVVLPIKKKAKFYLFGIP